MMQAFLVGLACAAAFVGIVVGVCLMVGLVVVIAACVYEWGDAVVKKLERQIELRQQLADAAEREAAARRERHG